MKGIAIDLIAIDVWVRDAVGERVEDGASASAEQTKLTSIMKEGAAAGVGNADASSIRENVRRSS
jgi:hypothetical protein